MNRMMIGGLALTAVAIPALALAAMDARGTTRAEAEAKVREHFAKLDANKDGFVVRDEAMGPLKALKIEGRDEQFARLDADKNGAISRAEFDAAGPVPGAPFTMRRIDEMKGEGGGAIEKHVTIMRHPGGLGAHGGLRHFMMMRLADADKDGRVSLKEAVDGTLAMFDKADANKDGTLTPEERHDARGQWREKLRMMRAS